MINKLMAYFGIEYLLNQIGAVLRNPSSELYFKIHFGIVLSSDSLNLL